MSRADALVIGAGAAGLSAARDLFAAGLSVIVLEARDRPGGRIATVQVRRGRSRSSSGPSFCTARRRTPWRSCAPPTFPRSRFETNI
ncbi:MAG: FAD-dependent oxidoreductase, partial [Thermoanaerobaculia bacterium]